MTETTPTLAPKRSRSIKPLFNTAEIKAKKIELLKVFLKPRTVSKVEVGSKRPLRPFNCSIKKGFPFVALDKYWDQVLNENHYRKANKTSVILSMYKYGNKFILETKTSFYLLTITEK